LLKVATEMTEKTQRDDAARAAEPEMSSADEPAEIKGCVGAV